MYTHTWAPTEPIHQILHYACAYVYVYVYVYVCACVSVYEDAYVYGILYMHKCKPLDNIPVNPNYEAHPKTLNPPLKPKPEVLATLFGPRVVAEITTQNKARSSEKTCR